MAERESRSIGRRIRRALLGGTAALLIVAGIGAVWLMNQPAKNRICIGGGVLDEVGAETAEAARLRWGAQYDLDYDIAHPDDLRGSGDRVTAVYLKPTPEADWGDPSHIYSEQITTQRNAEGVWHVVDGGSCEEWTGDPSE
ncbi:MAG: hypothetical protein KDB04_16975 [Acidimicrobiales bacterium]|nr:hypothetical protein [Acidimicrobiales bacterium]HRW37311.1 hypothetical protein [Aquihabitans sp.]